MRPQALRECVGEEEEEEEEEEEVHRRRRAFTTGQINGSSFDGFTDELFHEHLGGGVRWTRRSRDVRGKKTPGGGEASRGYRLLCTQGGLREQKGHVLLPNHQLVPCSSLQSSRAAPASPKAARRPASAGVKTMGEREEEEEGGEEEKRDKTRWLDGDQVGDRSRGGAACHGTSCSRSPLSRSSWCHYSRRLREFEPRLNRLASRRGSLAEKLC
ncbi:hypothetical protein EYF80_054078 [Liparis tanakae]|uniref:Uncharacterized protein n=1 Tax=Liparis tanakae TaxID=230148 RepID=A0A4Z2F4C2_9TELE|nr:hypothetical protein EYF80_054078 [Liparis tanakae]